MADGAELSIDVDAFEAAGNKLVRQYLTAGTVAIKRVTERLELKLEEATRGAVPGRLWRAWGSKTYPRSGPAKDPAGTIYLNGGARTRGAVSFWTQPGAIRGKSGQYLAVPLPSAGSRGRQRNLTPAEWERSHPGVRLQFVYRQGKPSLLVAIGGTTTGRQGGFVAAKKLTGGKRGRIAQGRGGDNPQVTSVVPIFVLLPMVKFRNAFAIEPLIEAGEGELAEEFFAAVRALG